MALTAPSLRGYREIKEAWKSKKEYLEINKNIRIQRPQREARGQNQKEMDILSLRHRGMEGRKGWRKEWKTIQRQQS